MPAGIVVSVLFASFATLALANAGIRHRVRKRAERIIHVKGFAAFFNQASCARACEEAVRYIQALDPDVIVWDGDEFGNDSFTYAIYLDRQTSGRERKYRAYCVGASPLRFQAWRDILGHERLEVVEIDVRAANPAQPSSADYAALGLTAMRDSAKRLESKGKSKRLDVFVIGMGPVVADEIRNAAKANVDIQIHLFDVVRMHPARGPESLLTQFVPSQVPANISVIRKELNGL